MNHPRLLHTHRRHSPLEHARDAVGKVPRRRPDLDLVARGLVILSHSRWRTSHDGPYARVGEGASANFESTMAAWRSVSLTGHLSAISSSFSLCSSVRSPSKEIIRWKQSIVDAPSGASIFLCWSSTVARRSVQLRRSTYILRVMAVHAPSAANKNSY